jgi:molybdopterin-guanine dinucleotide biosynthesis protein MobB
MLNFYHSRKMIIDSLPLPVMNTLPLPAITGQAVPEDSMANQLPPAVSFIAARSGAGKTTLITSLIAELKHRGYAVGAVKHGPPNFEIDRPGKDSYRFTEAGADNILVCSDNKLAFVKQYRQPPPLAELLANYFPDVDIILVEGFKQADLPRIEVYRGEHDSRLLSRGKWHDPNLLAVATDRELVIDVPQLDLNRPHIIVDFLLQSFTIS